MLKSSRSISRACGSSRLEVKKKRKAREKERREKVWRLAHRAATNRRSEKQAGRQIRGPRGPRRNNLFWPSSRVSSRRESEREKARGSEYKKERQRETSLLKPMIEYSNHARDKD